MLIFTSFKTGVMADQRKPRRSTHDSFQCTR